MGNNPEGKGKASPIQNALAKELFTTIVEVQEEQARKASDPKDKESHERLAEVARKNLRDLK
jgi:hypothetical protein